MSNIPIVQGVAMSGEPKYGSEPHTDGKYHHIDDGSSPSDQELRELRQNPKKQYQDVGFAVAFWAHLVVMIVFISMGLTSANGIAGTSSAKAIIFILVVCGLVSVGLSSFSLSYMMKNAQILVQVALIYSVISSLAVGIIGLMMGSILMGILGFLSFAVGICYAKIVWPRIPFAASNLNTALTCVKANMGVAAIAYGLTALAFLWSVLWMLGLGTALAGQSLFVVFLLFVSYYWVQKVIEYVIHVTVAGTVGTWWFVPDEANRFWSPAISDSFFRATTYSFGSVCFGGLLVALIRALRATEYYARDNDDFAFVSCIVQCILACIESIIDYVNQWALVYVGLYGFSYLEAGRNVVQLFENKGWTVVITDDLAENVLFMMSMAIGLASGLVGLLIGFMDSGMFIGLGYEHAAGPAFLVGFLVGFLFASILMSVVASAVNTVIVCYVEAPAEFQMNHPQLASEMRAAWTTAWPGLFT